jgi:dephospho-CoA kinase
VKRPFIIGLTGGIGSGKSTVAKILVSLGCDWYQADQVAKELYETDIILRRAMEDTFGDQVYNDNKLDRGYLAKIVFDDKKALNKLNQLIHPAVKRHFEKFALDHPQSIIVREAAILFESGSDKDCDLIVTVGCQEDIRIARVQKRDGLSADEILKRIKNQMTDEQRAEKSDEEIVNDGRALLIPQVVALLKRRGIILS